MRDFSPSKDLLLQLFKINWGLDLACFLLLEGFKKRLDEYLLRHCLEPNLMAIEAVPFV